MRKIRIMTALVLAFTLASSTAVFAAPSPAAGTVMVVVPGTGRAATATVSVPTQAQMQALASFIAANAASVGMIPTVRSTIAISAPADYKGGETPVVFAVSGLRDGARNVFAYILLKNGKTLVIPCTVKKGYVGFYTPAFGTVSIVELNAKGGSVPSVPALLH